MQFPRIHLNGTNGEQLASEYARAIESLWTAITDLKSTTCHGRDYYIIPRSSEARDPSSVAYQEHHDRIVKLEQVHAALVAIHANISEQVKS